MGLAIALPKTAAIELTYLCNHQCKFCSCPWENTENALLFYEKEAEMSIGEWISALAVLEKAGVKRVSISGGEALLKDGLDALLHHIRANTELNKGEKIVVISNGAEMDERYVALFKATGVHLSLSLPGLTTFAYHTGSSSNTADNVLYWLSRTKNEGIDTTVNITVTKKNFFELYETIANGLIAGAGTILLNRFLVGGRGITYQNELMLSKEELCEMLDIADDVLTLSKRVGAVGTEYPLCIMKERRYNRLNIGSQCAAATGFFVVDPSGYIRTCNHSPKRIGHIFDDCIVSDTDYWKIFADKKFGLPAMCENCQSVSHCDCGCREAAAIKSGSLCAPDPCFSECER